MTASHRRLWRVALAVCVAASVAGTAATGLASHQFSDVPTSAIYHAAVEWLANRGVTLGCATGLYCPSATVSRGQMALFMQRLGAALTPTFVTQTGGSTSGLDLDGTPVVCASAPYTPTFPQTALLYASASASTTSSDMTYRIRPVISTNSGASWSHTTPGTSVSTRTIGVGGGGGPTVQYAMSIQGVAVLAAGTSYRFGMRFSRVTTDSNDIGQFNCALFVEIVNRTSAASPLGGPARAHPQGGGTR
jgi:hypothetical protein